jgi:hypothetical protein
MPTLFQAPASSGGAPAGKPAKKVEKNSAKPGLDGPHTPSPVARSVMSPLTCFAVNPSGVRFETQQDDEEVILFLRQHVAFTIPWVVLSVILFASPVVLFPFVLGNIRLPFSIPASYIMTGTLFWYLATVGFALMNFLRWYFNIYIVTNERVVDIDFLHLLYKEFSEARLEDVQDINYKAGGIFAAFFNFGDVAIQTAGSLPNFEFDGVPKPDHVVQTISELAEKVKKGQL